ncbi:syntaxin-22-like isoform X1 [Carex littledalei]|uniref:Syntaxin-22-like isoform X1 n=1 Tax=Carex littledalei TaxID=544730 RepID=A0A833RE50_9POAL|nr:syntaxin-22-like isoform X1 [Carex littledalei]
MQASKKIADAKLAKDFKAMLHLFPRLRILLFRDKPHMLHLFPRLFFPLGFILNFSVCGPILSLLCQTAKSPLFWCSYTAGEINVGSDRTPEQRAALVESRRQEVLLLDNEIAFNEAIIEERDQGIQEIQNQIGEVNEIFKDLAVLVHEQGSVIDDIDSNIENAAAATVQAKTQLAKASKIQKSNSSLEDLVIMISIWCLFNMMKWLH